MTLTSNDRLEDVGIILCGVEQSGSVAIKPFAQRSYIVGYWFDWPGP